MEKWATDRVFILKITKWLLPWVGSRGGRAVEHLGSRRKYFIKWSKSDEGQKWERKKMESELSKWKVFKKIFAHFADCSRIVIILRKQTSAHYLFERRKHFYSDFLKVKNCLIKLGWFFSYYKIQQKPKVCLYFKEFQ